MKILYNRIITQFRSLQVMNTLMNPKLPNKIFSVHRLFFFPQGTIFDKLSPTQQRMYLTAVITPRNKRTRLVDVFNDLREQKELVHYVQYDQTYDLYARPTENPGAWWFQAADCKKALGPYSTNNPVAIAVIDSGIDHTHEDLKEKVAIQQDFSSASWGGSTIINPNGTLIGAPGDLGVHGTHVSGIIAALSNNTYTIGVAHKSKLLNIRAFPDATEARLCAAIDYVVRLMRDSPTMNIRVINASWGTDVSQLNPDVGSALKTAIDAACEKGIVTVCAAGNNDKPVETYVPAKFENVIAVGAITGTREEGFRKTLSSNYGPNVIGAPGLNILSLDANPALPPIPINELRRLSGTSTAAGFVSGLVARMIENNPDLVINTNTVGEPCNIAATILAQIETNPITLDTANLIGKKMIDIDRTLGWP